MGLVTTMAEEMQYFRSRISGKSAQDVHSDSNVDQIHVIPQFLGGQADLNNLIEVSDGEDEESEEEESEEEESDNESDEESESEDQESDNESESDSDEESESGDQVKNISIDLGNEIDLNFDNEFINVDESTSGESSNESIEECVETKTINLSEDISSFEISSKTLENIHDIDISIKLTDDYADLSSSAVDKDKIDYKKMSINKLREVAVEKGLVVDASKLKKNDILKLLGAEQ